MRTNEEEKKEQIREKTKQIAAKYIEKGKPYEWFEHLYKMAKGDNEQIPWADLEPNRFLVRWAEKANLKGYGRSALVVGCGLGDDAKFLDDLGFKVTAFDVSPKAIEWAEKIHRNTKINFYTVDLFNPPRGWQKTFDFVLEVYTVQALPLELREKTIKAISQFVAKNGELIVVARARETDEDIGELPWGLSPNDLSNFEKNGLEQLGLTEMFDEEEGTEDPIKRFVVEYNRIE